MKNQNKSKVNTLNPSMRENKRYLAYEIISKSKLKCSDKELINKINSLLGVFQSSDAGIIRVKYDAKIQKGVLRVNRKFVDHIRSCFVMIKELCSEKVLIRTLTVSGMVNKAKEKIE